MKISLLSVLGITSYVAAFSTDAHRSISQRKLFRSDTSLNFGIPTFGAKDSEEEEKNAPAETQNAKKEIGWKGLIQLITAGAGSPFLGDFEGVDEETGKFMFSLEANNLVDEVSILSCNSMVIFGHLVSYLCVIE